jgi:hypothetical protein
MSKSFFFNPKVMRPLRCGPLAQWLDGFAERLVQQGYSNHVGCRKMRLTDRSEPANGTAQHRPRAVNRLPKHS